MSPRPNELTAVEAARRIDAGELTVEALVRACLERIEEREPDIAAFAHLDREQVLDAAIAHDGAGPMHGVPAGVKDIVDTVDAPTTYGSPIYRDHWPETDAVCVNRIHAAGGIVIGKTVTTEFAARYPGPTRNPHDVRHTPGGSSSGSAAAVADCMIPLGIGTQTAGSVIRPCRLLRGLRLQADVRSAQLLRDPALRGERRHARLHGDGASRTSPSSATCCSGSRPGSSRRSTRGLRLGFCRTHHWDAADEATRTSLEDGARRLASAGVSVEDVELPPGLEDSFEVYNRLQQFEGARCLGPDYESHPDLLSVDARALRELGMAVDRGQLPGRRSGATTNGAPRSTRRSRTTTRCSPRARPAKRPADFASPATSRSTTCGPRSTCRPSPFPPSRGRRAFRSGRSSSPRATPTTGCSPSRRRSRTSSPDPARARRGHLSLTVGEGRRRPPPRRPGNAFSRCPRVRGLPAFSPLPPGRG